MNLVDGQIITDQESDAILNDLDKRIARTLFKGRLDIEKVISACHRMVTELNEGPYLAAMADLGIDISLGKKYIAEARRLFCEESMRIRLRTELGDDFFGIKTYTPYMSEVTVHEQIMPLGVLFHIAAGNMDGLPVFTVLEGLVTGNINILKLPSAEGGISVQILQKLIEIEPSLAEYIYVFDYSSRDIENIEKLLAVSDGVVVWGGDTAVASIRNIVKPNTKLIEWGHKLSFAYCTEHGITHDRLAGLAKNMIETNQLLCSSCQGIFIDTVDNALVYRFCEMFLPILEKEAIENMKSFEIGSRAQTSLRVYAAELESTFLESKVFQSKTCSLIAYKDRTLEPGIQFGNAWVRQLPKADLLEVLRPYKNYLQTVGLLCGDSERALLADMLLKAGAVRICSGERMSATYCGAAHDGEYPLRRYTKVVCVE